MYFKSKRFEGVYQYKKKNGDISFSITYKDTTNKTVRKTIGNKSNGITESYCFQIRNETVSKLRLGELPPKVAIQKKQNTLTLNDLAKFYFDNKDTVSKKKFENKYNNRIKTTLGNKDVRYLETEDIKKFQNTLLMDNLAPHTVNCYFDIVSAIINFASQKGIYNGRNPMRLVNKLRIDNKRERFLTTNEVNDVLEAVEDDWLLNLFLRLSLTTAGRISTILNIKKMDIELDTMMINLYDVKNRSHYIGHINENDTVLIELLTNRMKMIDDNDFIVENKEYTDSKRRISDKFNQIFFNLFNHKLESQNDRKNKVVIHTLRHTVLSHLAMNGNSPYQIKQISNHKSMKMLERYIKLDPSIGKEPIQNLWK